MVDELKTLLNEVSRLDPAQKGAYETWLVVSLIRDVAFYIVMGILAWALGRRLIHAVLTAYRESRRERA
jgi:hypothetical protein